MPTFLPFLLGSGLAAFGGVGAAPPPDSVPEELMALGSLVVGEWHAPDSRHVFEWGVARRVVRSRGYFLDGDDWRLVSEGLWFWDAQAGLIRATVITVGMPFHRMEYRTRVDGSQVIHRLRTFGAAVSDYQEIWTFDGDRYRWTLEAIGEDGIEPVMSGVYERSDGGPRP